MREKVKNGEGNEEKQRDVLKTIKKTRQNNRNHPPKHKNGNKLVQQKMILEA